MCPQNRVPDSFLQTTLLQETEDVFAWLLEIDHPSLKEPYRISSDRTEFYGHDDDGNPVWCTRHDGNVYFTHEAFDFIPPGQPKDGTAPTGQFVISWNPDIMAGIMNVHDMLTITGVYVDVSDPDAVISRLPKLLLRNITASGNTISAELGIDHFLDEPCSRIKFLPSTFPGLFRSGVTTEE